MRYSTPLMTCTVAIDCKSQAMKLTKNSSDAKGEQDKAMSSKRANRSGGVEPNEHKESLQTGVSVLECMAKVVSRLPRMEASDASSCGDALKRKFDGTNEAEPAPKTKRKYVPKAERMRTTGLPMRALNAYNYFFREQREKIIQDRESKLPEEKVAGAEMFSMMGKTVAKRWKLHNGKERSKYEGLARDDKERHRMEMAEYNRKAALCKVEDTEASFEEVDEASTGNSSSEEVANATTHHLDDTAEKFAQTSRASKATPVHHIMQSSMLGKFISLVPPSDSPREMLNRLVSTSSDSECNLRTKMTTVPEPATRRVVGVGIDNEGFSLALRQMQVQLKQQRMQEQQLRQQVANMQAVLQRTRIFPVDHPAAVAITLLPPTTSTEPLATAVPQLRTPGYDELVGLYFQSVCQGRQESNMSGAAATSEQCLLWLAKQHRMEVQIQEQVAELRQLLGLSLEHSLVQNVRSSLQLSTPFIQQLKQQQDHANRFAIPPITPEELCQRLLTSAATTQHR